MVVAAFPFIVVVWWSFGLVDLDVSVEMVVKDSVAKEQRHF